MPPSLRDTWTRGPDGRPIDWSQPPYRVGGRVCLLLAGEQPNDLSSADWIRRTAEYTAVMRRRLREKPLAR